ncbi:MAG: aminotransferase class III-fold pyridoxal phosphate-dependent enzyme [Bacillota bacterium]
MAPEDTAAVIEPVQGEGGFVVPPPEYLGRIAEICRKHDVLLIADGVQTGFGRTGHLFALEHSGVQADLDGTHVGNPVGCVAALEVQSPRHTHRGDAASSCNGCSSPRKVTSIGLPGNLRGLPKVERRTD